MDGYEDEIWMRARIEALEKANAAQAAQISDLENAMESANRTIEDERRREEHLKHTINVLQDALAGQAMLMGMILEAAGDETEQD